MVPSRTAVASCSLATLLTVAVAGCAPLYGANFRYPADLALPAGVTPVLVDDGWDDDDPIRTRLQVVDVGTATSSVLTDFYRETYPQSEGWIELDPPPEDETGAEQQLCLVNESSTRFTEVVEVFTYTGTRVEARPGRHLVMITRVQDDEDVPCGYAFPWIGADLYR